MSFSKCLSIIGVEKVCEYLLLKTEIDEKLQKSESNSTYLIKDIDRNLIKIGKTCDIKKRMKALRCSNPSITLIAITNCDIELELHKRYIAKRHLGEWFNLSDDNIKEIITKYKFESSYIQYPNALPI